MTDRKPLYVVATRMRGAMVNAMVSSVVDRMYTPKGLNKPTPLEASIHRTAHRGVGLTPRYSGFSVTRAPGGQVFAKAPKRRRRAA